MVQSNLQQLSINGVVRRASATTPDSGWLTFEQMLQKLHQEGIYLHSEQLAEFLLCHGLPVHLRYVPPHLHQRAIAVNENYQGDMAQLVEEWDDDMP